MNTAARDRALLPTVKNVLGRTPVSKLKLTKEKDGSLKVLLHTSRPNNVRMESETLTDSLKQKIGGRDVQVEVVAEARAVAKYVRVSARKARLVIDVIKGKRVSEALGMLRFIPNHAAELISKVLISAAANAQDGWGAGVDELQVHNILADVGPSLKRVRARAQGRAYRILKRTSHLTVILTEAPAPVVKAKRTAVPAKPKAVAAPAAPTNQTVTEQSGQEADLDMPIATPAEENRQVPGAEQGEGGTGDSANTPDSGQSTSSATDTAVTAETPETPTGVTPATASDAPEIDTSDPEPDTSAGADQLREAGE